MTSSGGKQQCQDLTAQEIWDREKRIKQSVLNATMNVKYHSSRKKDDPFTAKIATRKENKQIPFPKSSK